MSRTRIVLVRHGQTEWNVSRRFQGQADVPMDAHGRAQAEAAAVELAGIGATACYSSDLSRAMETAELVAGASGIGVTPDDRLREVHVGDWTGLLLSEVAERHPWYPESLRNRVDVRRSDTGETGTEAGSGWRPRCAITRTGTPGRPFLWSDTGSRAGWDWRSCWA